MQNSEEIATEVLWNVRSPGPYDPIRRSSRGLPLTNLIFVTQNESRAFHFPYKVKQKLFTMEHTLLLKCWSHGMFKYLCRPNAAVCITQYLLAASAPSKAITLFQDNTNAYRIHTLWVFYSLRGLILNSVSFIYLFINIWLFETGFPCASVAVLRFTL